MSTVRLDIVADSAEFEDAFDKAVRRVSAQVQVPGFRKGKAPRSVVERTYGREVFMQEAHSQLMDDLYRKAVDEAEITPVGDPSAEITAVEPFTFSVTVPVYPKVGAGDYASVRVEPIDAAVAEAEIEETIERLRKAASPWVDPAESTARPALGSQVVIDYTVMESDGANEEAEEDAEFIIGESGLLAQLEERIQQLSLGESAEFETSFAEDDDIVDAGLRGKTMKYNVTLKGHKVRELLPLDDEFAKTHGEAESLEELRNRVRDRMHQDKTSNARIEVLNQAIAKMIEGTEIEIPDAMIDRAVDEDVTATRQRLAQRGLALDAYLRLTGQTPQSMRAMMRPEAERRLRTSLILRAVADAEALEVDDADIDAAIDRMIQSAAGASDQKGAEEFFRSDYVRNSLRTDLFDKKLQDRVIEIVTEGRGAALNAWEAPLPAGVDESDMP